MKSNSKHDRQKNAEYERQRTSILKNIGRKCRFI